ALLFILGIKRMASPVTARSGIRWAGVGMLLATAATFATPGLHNLGLIVLALAIGTVLAWVSGKRVAMTDMPQMVALYNGLGGGDRRGRTAEVLRCRPCPLADHPGAGHGRRPDRLGLTDRFGHRLGQARWPDGQAFHLSRPAAVQRPGVPAGPGPGGG